MEQRLDILKNMTSFALFYNHLCLGDTIVMVSNFSATVKRWERKGDVVVIYDDKNNIIGINIFNTLNTLKIKALGLLHVVSKPVEEIVKDIVYEAIGLEIDIEKNTYILGKVISIEGKNIEVDINGNTIYCYSDSNVNIDDYVVVARNNERLPNGRLVKEVVPNDYGFITEIAFNATDNDLGKNIY